jgi:hypothetical protein
VHVFRHPLFARRDDVLVSAPQDELGVALFVVLPVFLGTFLRRREKRLELDERAQCAHDSSDDLKEAAAESMRRTEVQFSILSAVLKRQTSGILSGRHMRSKSEYTYVTDSVTQWH